MDAVIQEGAKRPYTTASWVQAWFLGRSRDNWKAKYKKVKSDAKRQVNRANDARRSRDKWRERAEKLEAENAALRERAALKKSGHGDGVAGR